MSLIWANLSHDYFIYLSISVSHIYTGFPESSVGKESTCNAEDPSSIPGSGRPTGERIGYPLQYCWASLVAQLVKNPPAIWETWVLSLGREDCLEKGKATHSLVFWPGEFHGLYSPSPWGHKESDTTEWLSLHFMNIGVHASFWIMVFSRHMSSSGIEGPYGSSIFSF